MPQSPFILTWNVYKMFYNNSLFVPISLQMTYFVQDDAHKVELLL